MPFLHQASLAKQSFSEGGNETGDSLEEMQKNVI